MGFLNNLLGKKPALTETEREEKAARVLAEGEELGESDPKTALKLLKKGLADCQDAVKIGGPLHERFSLLFLSLKAKTDKSGPAVKLPPVERIPIKQVPMFKDLSAAAEKCREDILYIHSDDSRDDADALRQCEALYTFGRENDLFMIVIGEETMFIKKALVMMAAADLAPDDEEWPGDIFIFAEEKSRLKVKLG